MMTYVSVASNCACLLWHRDKEICSKCWPILCNSARIIDEALRGTLLSTLPVDFGFQHVFWVFSGRRGLHCWVFDDGTAALDQSNRKSIINYITSTSQASKEDVRNGSQHPFIK